MARAGGSTSTISRSIRKRRERGLGRQQHRHDHRVDSETPRARLRQGVALAQTQLAWHSGTISESMSDATSGARTGRRHDRRSAYRRDGAGPERVLAWQLRHERKFYVGRHERSSGGQAARSEIGLSMRREQGPNASWLGSVAALSSNAEAPRARLGQAVAPARSSDRFVGVTSAAWAGSSLARSADRMRRRHERGLGK
jgi:hypothetical protein